MILRCFSSSAETSSSPDALFYSLWIALATSVGGTDNAGQDNDRQELQDCKMTDMTVME